MKQKLNTPEYNYYLPVYSISSAARLVGLSVHTLRLYEREGLLLPMKSSTNHRLYSQFDVDRINCIRAAINVQKLSIAGIKTIYSLIPCWKIKECSADDRANCAAFQGHSKPCWNYKHSDNMCGFSVCQQCEVYRDYSECDSIKEGIKKY